MALTVKGTWPSNPLPPEIRTSARYNSPADSLMSSCDQFWRVPSASRNSSVRETRLDKPSSEMVDTAIEVSAIVPLVLRRYQPVFDGAKLYHAASPIDTSTGVATNGRLAICPESA